MKKTSKRSMLAVSIMAIGLITCSTTPLKAENETKEIFRLYSVYSGEHFYTGSEGERDALTKAGWVYEGVGWTAPAVSETPVYRLYNEFVGDHHYTVNEAEKNALVEVGWKDEGIAFYSDETEAYPLYRQYNSFTEGAGAHNYTCNAAERDMLVTAGWNDEGISWYGSGVGWGREEAVAEIAALQQKMAEEAAALAAAAEESRGIKGTDIVAEACKWIGNSKYRSGGNNPATGTDCSGFTCYIFSQFGITLNRVAKSQAANGYKVSDPQPGDLALWTGHAAIYAGNNQIVDATSSHHGVDLRTFSTRKGAGTFMGFYHIPGVDNGN